MALAAFIALSVTAGCTSPAGKYDGAAEGVNFAGKVIQGRRFHHKIYRNGHDVVDGVLHVFIEGDASVKQALRSSPPDPTPRHPLMLRLMQKDESGAILLGRPCYHGLFVMDGCEIRHLGPERYSAEIVESMIAALRSELDHSQANRVILIGYSGGGTLAFLMAAQYPHVAALVTLAGNLDSAAFVAHHHSPPLSGSLDPSDLPALPRSIQQLHFIGSRDENAPASLAQKTLTRQGAAPIIMQTFDHECCWQDIWPDIQMRLHTSLHQPAPASESQPQ
ncbi:MAG: alpha/beta fold hydrolase [Alphaproteobacteria bacterium]